MRRRMRDELSLAKRGGFDLKQDPGGLADIEFLVDYWVLASSAEHPELVEFPDNVRQLEALERVGLVPADRCRRMKDAYLALRQRVHELALDEGGRVVGEHEFAELRAWVVGVWDEVFAGVEHPPGALLRPRREYNFGPECRGASSARTSGRSGGTPRSAECRSERTRSRTLICRCTARCRACTSGTPIRRCICR